VQSYSDYFIAIAEISTWPFVTFSRSPRPADPMRQTATLTGEKAKQHNLLMQNNNLG
jgi:hypothetical protein